MSHKHALPRIVRKPRRAAHDERGHGVVKIGFRFVQVPPTHREESLAVSVLAGFDQPQKTLPSQFFYDTAGSRLFEKITRLPEYYLTRCETSILQRSSAEILDSVGENFQIVEFGSGNSEKTR